MTTFSRAASAVKPKRWDARYNGRRAHSVRFSTQALSSYLDAMTQTERTLYVARDPRTAEHVYMYAGLMIKIPDENHVFLKDAKDVTTNEQVALRMGAITAEKVLEKVDLTKVEGMARYIVSEFNKQREKILARR